MQFVEWKPGDQMTAKKWDGYWEKGVDGQPLPYLDGIVSRLIQDDTVRTTELRTGNIEVATNLHPRNFPSLKADPKIDLASYPWNALVHYIIFNNKQDPTKNVKVRQAALYAIDREAMAKAIGMGVGSPTYYWWSTSDLGYDDTLPRYPYQPEKATQLLKEAGYANGIDINNSYMGSGFLPSTSEALKSMWDKVGIRTTLEVMERTAFVPKLQTANFQVATSTRDWGAADPDDYSFRLITDGTFNFAHFQNPEFDKCMAEGRETFEAAKRAEIYKRCQKILIEQVPYGEVWHYPKNVVFAKTLKNWQPHLFSMARLAEAWLDK
jgi:ABC-type transport system substrate-binding protein